MKIIEDELGDEKKKMKTLKAPPGAVLLAEGWNCLQWSAQGGYSNSGNNNKNRHKEALFYSPYCNNITMRLI